MVFVNIFASKSVYRRNDFFLGNDKGMTLFFFFCESRKGREGQQVANQDMTILLFCFLGYADGDAFFQRDESIIYIYIPCVVFFGVCNMHKVFIHASVVSVFISLVFLCSFHLPTHLPHLPISVLLFVCSFPAPK